eukprot:TRINITY_DN1378_c0_g1_i8.p1 TRINITY_DN1378_c0_g1~~TRINITY_DN1378_c0_g1_i8.p1  ORF type:complete len:181 (-),score=49.46 TRINITY_DN1378_c0_g1_i8:113-655(-)
MIPTDMYDIGVMHMRQAEADTFMELDHSLDYLFKKKEVWKKHLEEITEAQNAILEEAEQLWEKYLASDSPFKALPYHQTSSYTTSTTITATSPPSEDVKQINASEKSEERFLVGNSITVADCAFFPILVYFVYHGFPIKQPRFQNLYRYYEHMKMRSSVLKAWPHGWWGLQGKDLFRKVN